MRATVNIDGDDLAALRLNERLPLTRLEPTDHIHGRLTIRLGGRVLPHLGYWDANDVCFADWLRELDAVRAAFARDLSANHTFDEGEEGQPAFLFERDGARAVLTIANSQISDGAADPDWQRVEFLADDFISEYDRFRSEFVEQLKVASPAADEWLARHLSTPGHT